MRYNPRQYTLHVGLLVDDVQHAEEELYASAGDTEADAIYVDGDSFREWGEQHHDDPLHGQVVFTAGSHADAWRQGVAIFRYLVGDVDSPVNLSASCHDEAHVPFAVTLAEVWSAVVGPGGERTGDPDITPPPHEAYDPLGVSL